MFYLLYAYQAGYRYTNYSCKQHTKIRCKSLGIDYNFATYYTSFVSYPSGTELLGPSVAVGRGHEIILGPYAVSAETFFFLTGDSNSFMSDGHSVQQMPVPRPWPLCKSHAVQISRTPKYCCSERWLWHWLYRGRLQYPSRSGLKAHTPDA
jgi:hypothetical protein